MKTQSYSHGKKEKAPDLAYLFLTTAKGTFTFEIGDYATVGRCESNTVSIPDNCISRRHLKIYKNEAGDFCIQDAGSRNGIFLNGSKVSEAQLKEMDEIQVGSYCLKFSYSQQSTEAACDSMKSKNERWSSLLGQIPNFAQSDFPVLVLGASGTGKEVMARGIHSLSNRSRSPFVSLNCSALNDTLIESELFGHKKGSFTDAKEDRKGAFEQARGGTLFLDEIGDLPLHLQPKLLRALENKEIKSVGADQITDTDVRIICATHKNLRAMVQEGRFREDLFFRINLLTISIPKLSERTEDFEDIFYQLCKKYGVAFSVPAVEELKKLDWPGNIRELQNVVAKASVLFKKDRVDVGNLSCLLDVGMSASPSVLHGGTEATTMSDIEKQVIHQALIKSRGNQRSAAESLGMPKSTLNDKIKNFGIDIQSIKKTSVGY